MIAPIQPGPVDLRSTTVTTLPKGRGLAGRMLTYAMVAFGLVVLGDERCLSRLADGPDPSAAHRRNLSHA